MALTDEQRGPRAAWLYHHRVTRFGAGSGGLTALAEELGRRGVYRSPETIKGWEASAERAPIPPDVGPKLEEIFGEQMPSPAKQVSSAELVVALASQTAAITDLVLLLRPVVAEAVDREVRLRAVEAELALGVRPAAARSPRRRAPQARAR